MGYGIQNPHPLIPGGGPGKLCDSEFYRERFRLRLLRRAHAGGPDRGIRGGERAGQRLVRCAYSLLRRDQGSGVGPPSSLDPKPGFGSLSPGRGGDSPGGGSVRGREHPLSVAKV